MAANDELTKRVLWKLDLHVLPPLSLLWLANFIDRSNIGNARIAGLEADTHLKDTQFNVVLAAYFLILMATRYILVELPSNWVMKKFKANRWLPFLVASWGVVTVLTSLAQNYGGLIAIRLAIGLCEGGILPGMVLYLSTLYKRHELQLRVGIFYSFAAIAGAFGGLLATAIMKMDGIGGLAGWRWIFILEGIVTILFALGAACILPADLHSAKFFTNEERAHALRRMKADGAPSPELTRASSEHISSSTDDAEKADVDVVVRPVAEQVIDDEEERFEWREVIRAFAYFGFNTVLYSYSLFLPTIITGLGYSGAAAQLHTGEVAFTLEAKHLVDITQQHKRALQESDDHCDAASHRQRCVRDRIHRMLSAHSSGPRLSVDAYPPLDQKPKYIKGHTIALTFVALAWVLIAANVCYCLWEDKARREGRRQQNIQDYLDLVAAGKTRAPIGDRHPDFRFTL
ncbi:major facilitator superfamily domain-containing protein [Schizophyllum commune]